MTYTPRPGDIGLTEITGAGGAAIKIAQWLNGTGWNRVQHAYVVTANHNGRILIAEAMPGGAREVDQWHRYNRWLICPDEYRTAVARAAQEFADRKTPYSWLDYVSLDAHRLHVPAPHLRSFIRASGHMICSQAADYCAMKGGWHLFNDGRWEGDVTPGDLNKLWAKWIKDGSGRAA